MNKIIAYLLSMLMLNEVSASNPQELTITDPAFRVNGVWYHIPRGFFEFRSTNPDLTFAEAMKISNRFDTLMELEGQGNKLALNSDVSDREHQFSFLLMLEACNDYKVTSPPTVLQVLNACGALRACRPEIVTIAQESKQKKQKGISSRKKG